MCIAPIWTLKHETAKWLAQRIKTVLDVVKPKWFRSGENLVTAIREGKVLPPVKAKVQHHDAMPWREVPAFFCRAQRAVRHGGQGAAIHHSDRLPDVGGARDDLG